MSAASSPSTTKPTFFSKLPGLILWACAGWSAIGAVRALLSAASSITFKYAHNYTEPVVAALTLNIPNNPLLYAGFDREPFLINPYNPLYLYLSHAVTSLAGGSALLAGRAVTLASSLTICALIYGLLRLLEGQIRTALLCVSLFVLMPIVTGELASMRPDMMGLALSLAGLYCALIHENCRHRHSIAYWSAVFCFAFAYFTKQNFVVAPAAYFLFLLTERRWKDAIFFGIQMSVILTVPTLLWDAWTLGNYRLNQAMSVKKAFYPSLIWRFWKQFLPVYAIFTAASVAGFGVSIRDPRRRLLFLYTALALFSTVALGKIGSDWNYFLEFFAAGAITVGLWINRSAALRGDENKFPAQPFWRSVTALTVVALCLQFAPNPIKFLFPKPKVDTSAQKTDFSGYDSLVERLRQIQGPVLSENMGILIAAGKPVVFEPYGFAQLAYAGLWDESIILDRLARGEFALIILETNLWQIKQSSRFTPAFVQYLRKHYRPIGSVSGLILCRPKSNGSSE
jgi:hypothetical protein